MSIPGIALPPFAARALSDDNEEVDISYSDEGSEYKDDEEYDSSNSEEHDSRAPARPPPPPPTTTTITAREKKTKPTTKRKRLAVNDENDDNDTLSTAHTHKPKVKKESQKERNAIKFTQQDTKLEREIDSLAQKNREHGAFTISIAESAPHTLRVMMSNVWKASVYARKHAWSEEYLTTHAISQRAVRNAWQRWVERLTRRLAFQALWSCVQNTHSDEDTATLTHTLRSLVSQSVSVPYPAPTQLALTAEQTSAVRARLALLVSSAEYSSNPLPETRMTPTLLLDVSSSSLSLQEEQRKNVVSDASQRETQSAFARESVRDREGERNRESALVALVEQYGDSQDSASSPRVVEHTQRTLTTPRVHTHQRDATLHAEQGQHKQKAPRVEQKERDAPQRTHNKVPREHTTPRLDTTQRTQTTPREYTQRTHTASPREPTQRTHNTQPLEENISQRVHTTPRVSSTQRAVDSVQRALKRAHTVPEADAAQQRTRAASLDKTTQSTHTTRTRKADDDSVDTHAQAFPFSVPPSHIHNATSQGVHALHRAVERLNGRVARFASHAAQHDVDLKELREIRAETQRVDAAVSALCEWSAFCVASREQATRK